MQRRCEENEIGLCLELSVGGSTGKRRRTTQDSNAELALRFEEEKLVPMVRRRGLEYASRNAVDLDGRSSSCDLKIEDENLRKGGVPAAAASTPLVTAPKAPKEIVKKPPKAPSSDSGKIASTASYIPRVSTTGNGPNGKTIRGLLYKYTQNEVSIMCECHGCSFSPAEFVEHAGAVDVSNPLRHITVVHPTNGMIL